ncbi:hypothetical protein A3K70_04675 [Candidatus Bathyarchaeota archaeon RBG_16_48_13]|nr:MAG: hypothetical protein A3K70_04675 [Candidatus Bathyarchaeota archaeon RBG_16_48_13]
MEWKKALAELVELLAQRMKKVDCQFREMFGYPAYFINGNMFTGVHAEDIFLRLSTSDIQKIMKTHSQVTPFEPMPGRAMSGYVVIPKTVHMNDKAFAEWLGRSIEYVSSLPPKQKKR